MTEQNLSRRTLLAGTGALVVSILLPEGAQGQSPDLPSGGRLNERIEVRADGTIHVHVGRIEMGQGLRTAIATLAAEELEVPPERIVVAPVDTASAPNEGYTDGSASMQSTGTAVRRAAAAAREALLALASRQLGVPAPALRVEDGIISGGGRRVSYGALAGAVAAQAAPAARAALKPPRDYRRIGRAAPRLDLPAKLTGRAAYLQDFRLPGMRHARVLRPPSYGARLAALDTDAVAALPGVAEIVRNGRFVAVVAEREDEAIRALDHLRSAARWRESESLPGRDALFAYLRAEAGLAEDEAPSTGRRISATYEVPYRMHGAIGPSAAVAEFRDGRLTVWTHAQGVYPLRASLAGLLGLPESRVRCIHMESAGCYGHNGADDAAADAALIARAVPGRPVRLQWMREDEHLWEPYGPAMVMRLSGEVDRAGRVAAWRHIVVSAPHASRPGGAARLLAAQHVEPPVAASFLGGFSQWGGGGGYNAEPYYEVPARVDSRFVRHGPLRSSALRSLGAFANVVAIESFMDELALSAGLDPAAFRAAHLRDPRAVAVIEQAVADFGWQAFRRVPGRGRGIGFARLDNSGAYVAVVSEAEIDAASGRPRIRRMVGAVDCGEVISPDGVRNQIEGGMVQAASWTLLELVDFDRSRVLSRDWDSYPILRITEAPNVTVSLIDRPGEPYLGVGEAAMGPAGASVANAVAQARGRRRRTLPLADAG
ncbi:molybdopterin cofactor-binding domain-containing protein [Xanthobacter sp. KR7-225]|uniref:xanthine dehydrogenase family protein molybdopterin-binding subunit n=1 Tax=Xanthobacter sp. KR7-225 TaxID=3156613 RepID=UPI0032B5018C